MKMKRINIRFLTGVVPRSLGHPRMIAVIVWSVLSGLWGLSSQVVYDTSTSNIATSGTTVTVSHPTGTGNFRLMLVGVSTRDRIITVGNAGEEVTTVTYGGEGLIYVGRQNTDNDAITYLFMMIDPPSGTANVVVTFTSNLGGNNAGIVGVTTFSNVNLSNPIGNYTSAAQSNNNAPSVTVSSTNTNQIVFAVMALGDEPTTITLNSGQTQRWLYNANRPIGSGYTRAGQAGSTTLSYTLNTNRDWSLSAVAVNALPNVDLSVTKTANDLNPYVGAPVSFTLTATNNSLTDTAYNVVVTDLIPAGFSYVSHSPPASDFSVGTGAWDVGKLNPNSSTALVINVIVNENGPYANTATISGAVNDNNNGNNSSTVTITICQAGGQQPLFDD